MKNSLRSRLRPHGFGSLPSHSTQVTVTPVDCRIFSATACPDRRTDSGTVSTFTNRTEIGTAAGKEPRAPASGPTRAPTTHRIINFTSRLCDFQTRTSMPQSSFPSHECITVKYSSGDLRVTGKLFIGDRVIA